MPFLDFKFLIRDSAAIIDKLLPSTDHYFVKMICTLRHHHNNATNNNKKKPKPPQPSSTNTDPPAPSITKSPPAIRRNFLSANPAATASYNQQIADTINSYKASNNNIHLHQEIITSILQSSSSAFPALQANKKEWFAQDATNLITLISAKKRVNKNTIQSQPTQQQ